MHFGVGSRYYQSQPLSLPLFVRCLITFAKGVINLECQHTTLYVTEF